MRYDFDDIDGVVVARVRGQVDGGADGRQFCEAVRHRCRQGPLRLVIDCANVTRVTAFGVGVFATSLALVRNVGGSLALAAVPGPLRSLLLITDLQASLACYDTVDAAAAALRRQSAPAPTTARPS